MKRLLMAAAALALMATASHADMPHNRPCDKAQDNPGNLNPEGGNAIMFGSCNGTDDAPVGQGLGEGVSRHQFWNAYNCGYQALPARQGIRCQSLLQRRTGNALERRMEGCSESLHNRATALLSLKGEAHETILRWRVGITPAAGSCSADRPFG